ncbi:UDP-N-acetylglucosamine--N-acetylmuramyl-(pentapeptide) pyrophosphoryl-undecaprenol N-acetylglucosamine transferase 2 [Oceanobacillus oncorhynchi subsp. incaldanensis]|uniref:UDP-N-acetylglucosamine--N-acetylmuramyl-(pentapeptide) pyrophosphoryl-undecaprenol N-acetylglucosamine transferase n=1 Tax=Oceanobacillus oncorhynchi TaxID=545501 RepID=A0A0A1MXF7_9BACI|nr:undecaprenyldiphospho-muramoylpentapeptide beta-N-acetylglucosaminyltransferase [Oceanobacillus oncorhynchi]GIO20035.1 UDP-N-acetylglucosamine--N-acetylmuramyl-(pentapeptide) pyrophosphoryl-undecaprenol N-acetylglucosamine transferase 2 [Oceanobacillus oncorhynchi subsp. incaldanensis]CEI83481.1 UDP-N-acetylglucosamine--N-acetylmuramyl-(pentapeptide) pyrophosphoryl-undecaprenol N-acetylglucosamine transferase [Oceanobacillus oncorhynchi]
MEKRNKKRILFTGGGTAGHVIVNLALIPYYQEQGYEVDYIGSYEGIERNLIEKLEGVTYHPVSTGKLRRYMSKENFKDPFKVLKGTMQAFRILGKRKPSVVFSKGGFVSVPVVAAAKLRGIPSVIHESDFTPGLANKLSIPFTKKVLATFPETMQYLPEKKAAYVGAVIRDELFTGDKKAGLAFAQLSGEKPVLLVMGGSGGSEKINSTIREALDDLLTHFEIIHICGSGKVDSALHVPGYAQFEYVHEELKDIFAATDFVVSRAGSNAIFEFLALRKPMLLIPLSRGASRGDQIINANSFKEKKYAKVVEEETLTTEKLIQEAAALKKAAPVMLDEMKKYKSEESRDKVIEIIQSIQKK